MNIIDNIWLGKETTNEKQVFTLLEKGIKTYGIYLVCILKDSGNLIEIIKVTEINKSIYKNKDYFVIGMASSKKESTELVKEIIQSYYKKIVATDNKEFNKENFCEFLGLNK